MASRNRESSPERVFFGTEFRQRFRLDPTRDRIPCSRHADVFGIAGSVASHGIPVPQFQKTRLLLQTRLDHQTTEYPKNPRQFIPRPDQAIRIPRQQLLQGLIGCVARDQKSGINASGACGMGPGSGAFPCRYFF